MLNDAFHSTGNPAGKTRALELITQECAAQTGFLDLGNLGLTELPAELFALKHLRRLNLGSGYPDPAGNYQDSGNEFDINSLAEIPEELNALSQLTHLSLCGCDFGTLSCISQLRALESLDCSGTGVTDLKPLKDLSALQSLNCSTTKVADLTPLKDLTALQSLNCSSTQVADLTPLKDLTALRQLDCFYTQVTDLTPLRGLPALQGLDCSDTQVSDLTPLKDLTALQSLNCSGTKVADLTPLKDLTALQGLYCWNTKVADLTPLKDLSALQSLNCGSTQVADLTPLKDLSALQSLNCSSTQVADLTPLKDLSALQSLNCGSTQVADLTPLKDLTALQSLYCSRTKVADLTPLKDLTALQSLYCSRTKVADLTPLKDLTALRQLNCSDTQVADLTPLKDLTALEELYCFDTQVTDLTPLLCVPRIQKIDADGCPLNDWPEELTFKPSLRWLNLNRVKVRGVPSEVLSNSGTDNCLEKLRAHLRDLTAGEDTLPVSKLVVLGNGRVGKTQICRALRRLPFDESVPTTHGITITNLPWPDVAESERLNLWDFGGQDIYHGTHALFLKTKASFLLVWHPDFEGGSGREPGGVAFQNQPLAYWLEYICTLGGGNRPPIVVQSRCDRPEQEARKLPVDDHYLNFRFLKTLHCSAKQKRGTAALREAITEAILDMREREGDAVIGRGRLKVMQKLEAWRSADQEETASEKRLHRTLTLAEFEAVCDEAGGISSTSSLLEYLHNIGAVFYRPELFTGKIILDQTWALGAIYSVFDREKSCRQIMNLSGRFTRSLLGMAVWSEYSEEEQQLFISLMLSCGICFRHREADVQHDLEAEYIVPELLPDKTGIGHQLDGRWDEAKPARRLVFEFPFLHPGLMRSLICDAGKRAKDAGIYWKQGVWVYEPETGCRVLLEQEMTDAKRGRIQARLQGERGDELARWLREQIKQRSHLFGYQDIQPTVDEFPKDEEARSPKLEMEAPPDPKKTDDAVTAPKFDKMPVSEFPKRKPEVFVSYAWGDAAPEGMRREKLVDDFCESMRRTGIEIRRDRDEMKAGDRISEFMDRLVEGDFIICVISDKYLRSPYCMYELFNVYRRCGDKAGPFLKKVIPLILPDADLGTVAKRLQYAGYWKTERIELGKVILGQGIDIVGEEAMRKYFHIKEFSHNVSNILELLTDQLMPRDFDRMAKEDFAEVRQLISGR